MTVVLPGAGMRFRRLAVAGWVVLSVAGLSGCGLDFSDILTIPDPCPSGGCPPQDCATLSSSTSWSVSGFGFDESTVAVGSSVEAYLAPVIENRCETSLESVSWRSDDASLASVAAQGTDVWITGVALGVTSVGARITFRDGVTRDARPRTVRVKAPEPGLGGELIAEGSLTIPPYTPSGPGRTWSGWVPFTTQKQGRIDVLVDWVSPLNGIDFSGYEGHCNAIGSCGMIRMSVRTSHVKPLAATFDSPRTPAGPYTIRIDNLGPDEETVRYEIRLTQ